MAAENFWDNRENAQKFVEESSSLRKRIEPFRKAETQLADLLGMVELGVRRMKRRRCLWRRSWNRTLLNSLLHWMS